jgi:mannosyltransferase
MSAGGRLDASDIATLAVIVPNLSRRYSGVTATSRMVTPRIVVTMPTAWLGPNGPDGVRRIGIFDLLRLRFARRDAPVVWHARRNVEMIVGVLLRAFGWPLKLVFTSAAQRRHKALTRWLMARMDALIATSAISASYLVPDLRARATVIEHGVDTTMFHPPADRDAAWRAAGLPGRIGIGCFGRVRAQKGTDVFVEAMCRLLPRYPDFTAVVVGEVTPDQRAFASQLEEKVKAAGLAERIVFCGYRPIGELPDWYRRITIFAFTSRNEGFGLTLLEAMASGNALVASRAGAAEMVVKDGDDGLLVPPGDADALVAALEPLLRDPARARAMGQRAAAHATAFSVDAEAAKIATVYRPLRDGAQ